MLHSIIGRPSISSILHKQETGIFSLDLKQPEGEKPEGEMVLCKNSYSFLSKNNFSSEASFFPVCIDDLQDLKAVVYAMA